MRSVETVVLLVVVATVVATFARRLAVPAPSLLVVVGLLVGLAPGVPEIRVSPDVVGLVVLPPLLYAAGEEMPWRELRAVWRPVTVLAVGLVLCTAVVVGLLAPAVTPLSTGTAFVLGAVLASTDPVAVAALGRRLALPTRVQVLVQAESLFNDATSLVLFRIAVGVALAGTVAPAAALGQFALLVAGGTAVGAVVAAGAAVVRTRAADPVLQAVTALVTPYAAFVVAEGLHTSGVTAVVVAAVLLGARPPARPTARLQLAAVNATVVFVLESVVFGLIGLQLPTLVRSLAGEGWLLPAVLLAAVLIAVRAVWVLPLAARRRAWPAAAVVTWSGARGVVPLAATLSIPLALPDRPLVQVLATTVIVISLVVQGFTLAPVVRRAGLVLPPDAEDDAVRRTLAQAGLEHLDRIGDGAPTFAVERARRLLQGRARATSDDEPPAYRRLRRDLIAVERAELHRLYGLGRVSEGTRRRVERVLDLEDAALDDD